MSCVNKQEEVSNPLAFRYAMMISLAPLIGHSFSIMSPTGLTMAVLIIACLCDVSGLDLQVRLLNDYASTTR